LSDLTGTPLQQIQLASLRYSSINAELCPRYLAQQIRRIGAGRARAEMPASHPASEMGHWGLTGAFLQS